MDWIFGQFALDPHRQLLAAGVPVHIGKKALDVLSVLAAADGGLVTKDELMDAVWKGVIVEDNALQAQISQLRKLLGSEAGRLVAVHGQGYRITLDHVADPDRSMAFIAVLPFTNRSGLAEDDVFAFGMVEDLVDALLQGVNVRVLSCSATMHFRNGTAPDFAAWGEKLGVGYLLDGNVRRTGHDLRVTAHLTETEGGTLLWTRNFDRPLADLAALQEELVSELAAHLGAQVMRQEMSRALKKPSDQTAWECLMRERATWLKMEVGTLSRAREEAERAIAIAPDYALAHATLASGMATGYRLLGRDDPVKRQEVSAHINKALELEPDNSAVLVKASQALSNIGLPGDALCHALRAIEISPRLGSAHYACGIAYSGLNRIDEALAHYQNYLNLEPESPHHYMIWHDIGRAQIRAGNWVSADVALLRSLRLNSGAGPVHRLRAITASHLGLADEALEAMIKSRQIEPNAILAEWEQRLIGWFGDSPVFDEMIACLSALWRESEEDVS